MSGRRTYVASCCLPAPGCVPLTVVASQRSKTWRVLDSNIPMQHWQYDGLLGDTSGWVGVALSCNAPLSKATCVLDAQLGWLHTRHSNDTAFTWVTSVSRDEWQRNFSNGVYGPPDGEGLFHVHQFGGIVDANATLQYTFEDDITFTSIARVDAHPSPDWYHEGALWECVRLTPHTPCVPFLALHG